MLIYNAKVVTWDNPNQILDDSAVYIQGNLIKEIGPSKDLYKKYSGDEKVIDAEGQLLMPGQICAHTHFYGAYSRGLYVPGVPSRGFPEILQNLWYRLDRSLDEESTRLSGEIFVIDAIKNGCTTLFDHHASPNFIDGSLDVLEDVIDRSGLRGSLCYEVTDRNGMAGAKAGIHENERFIKKISKNNHGGRLSAKFGIHASLTVSDETLDGCAEACPAGYGFHVHCAESKEDQWDSLYKYGKRVVERMYDHKILGDHTIVAHAVHCDMHEMELLKETGTWVSHQPRSNMNNAVGAAPVESMLHDGMKVCLGNDGFTFDMWSEWKMAYYLQKVMALDPRRMNANDVAQMAVYNNGALSGQEFGYGEKFGKIVVDAPADLILVDYKPFTALTPGNIAWQVIFGMSERMITTTICDGKILMENRRLLTMDEDDVIARSQKKYPEVWKKFNELSAAGK